jgi:hypothetical protein
MTSIGRVATASQLAAVVVKGGGAPCGRRVSLATMTASTITLGLIHVSQA